MLVIEGKEEERRKVYLTALNNKQIQLIENEEKCATELFIRIVNNFEAMLILFDNFIFEEEFISLGDEEYFKERKDYNFLLKLKAENKNGLNLDSKRTFKKLYVGLDRNKLKIDYVNKFKNLISVLVQSKFTIYLHCFYKLDNEEKLKNLEHESKKELMTKNIVGLKLQNNKSLFIERNKLYESYTTKFKTEIDYLLEKFNKYREEELAYQKSWNEIIGGLINLNSK